MWIAIAIVAVVAVAAWLANDFRALWAPAALGMAGAVLALVPSEDRGTEGMFTAVMSLFAGALLMAVVLVAVALRRRFSGDDGIH